MSSLLITLVILGLIALVTGIPWIYRLCYLELALAVGVRWWSRHSRKGIRLMHDLTRGTGFAGTNLCLKLELINTSRVPLFWGRVSQSFPEPLGAGQEEALIWLKPRGRTVLDFQFRAERRGVYPLPQTRLSWSDPWGLTDNSLVFHSGAAVVVYPPLRPIIGLEPILHLPWGRYPVFFGLYEDPARLRGCRDYTSTDSFKRIHWPNLARTGKLQVKEWETTLQAGWTIFLNLNEPDYPVDEWFSLSELGIELAAALAHGFSATEPVGFYCNGRGMGAAEGTVLKFPPKQGTRREQQILFYLAGVEPRPGMEFSILCQEARSLAVGSCLLWITPAIGADLVRQAEILRRLGYYPVVLWLRTRGGEDGQAYQAQLDQAGIQRYTVIRRREDDAIYITR